MSKHDQAALDAATQIIDLFSSPGQWRDTWHLKHKVQCLLIDLLERNATQPAAGEPQPKYRDRSNHDVIRREESLPCFCWAESDHRIGQEVDAPPAAAHGDEAVLPEAPELLISRGELLEADTLAPASAYRLVNAEDYRELREAYLVMRAQGDGEVL